MINRPIPEEYKNIDRIEVHTTDGEVLVIEGESAREWAETVDWGIRMYHTKQVERYGALKTDFEWRKL